MKLLSFFKTKKDASKSFYIKDDKIRYINWSEGHLFKGNLWYSRHKYLQNVANIVKDTNPIIRDGTKTLYQNSFKKLLYFK